MMDFLVVKVPFAYNAIIGRSSLRISQAMVSIYHLMIKFPSDYRDGELKCDQVTARECYFNSLKG